MSEDNRRLAGKVAIVTGAGSSGPGVGNGKASAILMAREGAKILLVDTVRERAEETLTLIQQEGNEASISISDVTDPDQCQTMVDMVISRYGRLDILNNNVGIIRYGSVLETSHDDWDLVMKVNLNSIFLASRYAIPKMITSGGGSIINISSLGGIRAAHHHAAYSASKAAIIGLTYSMATDHGRDNIRVNCIAPGNVYTPMVAARMTEDTRKWRQGISPLGTEGTAWDVAGAALYLASDESRWITGVVIPVDAGLSITHLGSPPPNM